MRIQFKCELDDFVDTQMRFMARAGDLRAYFWRSLSNGAVLGALAALAIGFVFAPWPNSWKLMIAAGGTALGAGWQFVTYKNELKKQIVKAWHCTSGGDERLTCEIELTEAGIRLKHQNTESAYPWEELEEVREGDSSIDIFMHQHGCGMAVHKRVFTSPEEMENFITLLGRRSSARVIRV